MSFHIVEGEGTATIVLGESVSIEHVEELHAALLALISSGRRVTIDAAGVKSLHTAIVQLLLSLGKSATGLAVSAPSNEFVAMFQRIGAEASG